MRDLGKDGERRAAEFLESRGYEVLDRGFRAPTGELDLVCRRRGTVIFVEVKLRGSKAFGEPQLAVDRSKQLKLAKTAAAYLKAKRPGYEGLRFDVVAIGPDGLSHIENAFESPIRFTL